MYHHYPLYIRLWHLLNALFFLFLILTGLNMQFSNPDHPFISFAISIRLHKICGVGLALNYLLFFIGKIFGTGGLLLTDLIHVILGFLMSLCMFVHIYKCTLAKTPSSSFRAIITGWQQVEKE